MGVNQIDLLENKFFTQFQRLTSERSRNRQLKTPIPKIGENTKWNNSNMRPNNNKRVDSTLNFDQQWLVVLKY